jgi:hypothetical protein
VRAPLSAEPVATCDSCVMLPAEGEVQSPGQFNPATKCCAYTPTLHNYLVGSVLAERDPAMAEGRGRVVAAIEGRIGVTPMGILPPSHFARLYGPERFGQSESLRCPYYIQERGQCGVWKHRNAVCSTWFCKHARGAASRIFWKALEVALGEAEKALARAVVLDLDVGPEAIAALFPHPGDVKGSPADLDRRVDEEQYRRVWGRWLGREQAFYRRAAEIAGKVGWDGALRLGGSELAARVKVARDAFAAFQEESLPARLRVGSFQVVGMDANEARLETYTPFDPIELPNALVNVLHRFNGQATKKAVAAILHEDGLEAALVQKLVDFGVLVEDGS